MFLNTYGSPLLQAMVGLGVQQATPRRVERDLVSEAREAQLRAELEHRFEVGGLEEAVLRALVYIRLPEGSIDERGFAVLRLIRASRPAAKRMSLARFKEMLREQYLLVRLDEERAVSALPKLLGEDAVGAQGSAGCPASGPGGAWRPVGRRRAPPGAGRNAVRCAAGQDGEGGGGACLITPSQPRRCRTTSTSA